MRASPWAVVGCVLAYLHVASWIEFIFILLVFDSSLWWKRSGWVFITQGGFHLPFPLVFLVGLGRWIRR